MAPRTVEGRGDLREGLVGDGRLVTHDRDLADGSEMWLWVFVTVQAPSHGQGCALADGRHFIDSSVTTFASNARHSMNRMIEKNEVGQVMDSPPTDRTIFPKAR